MRAEGTRGQRTRYSFIVAFLLIFGLNTPAYADPAGGIPDPGVRPPGSVAVATGTTPVTTTPLATGLDAQILAETTALGQLEQQSTQAKQIAAETAQSAAAAKLARDTAAVILAGWQAQVDAAAASTYRESAGLGDYAGDLRQLSKLTPGKHAQEGTKGLSTAKEYLAAKQYAQDTEAAYVAASAADERTRGTVVTLGQEYTKRNTALTELKARREAEIAAQAEARAKLDRERAALLNISVEVDGTTASPQAKAAVAFALSQVGKPYVWATEGPNTYDCSGLMIAAYRKAGVTTLPRVANDQFHGTTAIPLSKLLPGDLVFYSNSATDWRQIYHVVMYLGNGKIVQAPQPGQNVQVSTISMGDFFGATRVVPAVAVPKPVPTPTPTPTPSATPTP